MGKIICTEMLSCHYILLSLNSDYEAIAMYGKLYLLKCIWKCQISSATCSSSLSYIITNNLSIESHDIVVTVPYKCSHKLTITLGITEHFVTLLSNMRK